MKKFIVFMLAVLMLSGCSKKPDNSINEKADGKISVLDIYDFSHSYKFKNNISFSVTSPKHQIYLFDKMMISSNFKNKNEAWNIIKMILLDEYQNNISENKSGFPVKIILKNEPASILIKKLSRKKFFPDERNRCVQAYYIYKALRSDIYVERRICSLC